MEDKKLKDMWTNLNELLETPFYGSQNIESFINRRSSSISSKVKNTLLINLIIKAITIIALIINILFYYPNTYVIFLCSMGLLLVILSLSYDLKTMKLFNQAIDYNKSAREKLKDLHALLYNNTNFIVMSSVSSFLVSFPALILLYFYIVYGQIKPMPPFGFLVFGTIHIIGCIYSYIVHSSQLKFHTKHMEACLAEFDDDTKMFISHEIEEKRKQDAKIKLLIYIILLLAFVVLVAILKKLGIG